MIRLLVAVALLLNVAVDAMAESRLLNAAEVNEALTGNTARGVEPGPAFLQYFDANGVTTYATRSAPVDHGRWRVDDDGRYCSQWRDGGWACYEVWAEGDRVVWVSSSGTRYPAVMVEGRVAGF